MNKDLSANYVSYFVIVQTGLQFSHACARSRAVKEGGVEPTSLLKAKKVKF